MLCSKCGREIEDGHICAGQHISQAQVQVQTKTQAHAATYTGIRENQVAQTYSENVDTPVCTRIKEYRDLVDSYYIMSIISLILSWDIGFVLMIISDLKRKKLPNIDFKIDDQNQLAEYESAQRKLKKADLILIFAKVLFCIALACALLLMVVLEKKFNFI